MNAKRLLTSIIVLCTQFGFGQEFYQDFDGTDTAAMSLIIDTTNPDNIWQIGAPQKTLFNAPLSAPNVMITDTINNYPINSMSSFTFQIDDLSDYFFGGIFAMQWMQKLDLEPNHDGGIIEFSTNSGETWENAFNNPYVYNFYGFDEENKDTLISGDFAFSGRDTVWRDIWLCFDISWLTVTDTLMCKFTLQSDSIDNGREGWMIDNMLVHPTWFHTINENEQSEYLIAFPNPTNNGIVNIQARKTTEFHIIEYMELRGVNGEFIREYVNCPTKFQIDISDLPKGTYLLKVKTNLDTETFKIIH